MKTLADLRDIQGLDAISWWPLAIGWWIALVIVLGLVSCAIFLWVRAKRRARSWQAQAQRELERLGRDLRPETSRDHAVQLAVLLRRLAIAKQGREACASLQGTDWLTWLEANDLNHFEWSRQGESLLKAPYAPEGTNYDLESLKASIQAAKGWAV